MIAITPPVFLALVGVCVLFYLVAIAFFIWLIITGDY